MSKKYQNSEEYTSVDLTDEDDEFGGGRLTPELIYGDRYKKTSVGSLTHNKEDEDEDDEFGSAKLTPELIYGENHQKSIDSIPQEDDEFGGASLTSELIYGCSQAVDVNESVDEDENEIETIYSCEYKIFSPKLESNQWYIDRDELTNDVVDRYTSLTIPLVIDTEFTDDIGEKPKQIPMSNQDWRKRQYHQNSRLGLTTQITGIDSEAPKKVFALDPRVNAGRMLTNVKQLPRVESIFHPIDYLRSINLNVEIWEGTESELADLPKCFFVLYGHFLTAEINMIASGSVKERIKELQRAKQGEMIASGRRAYCQQIVNGQTLDWVSLKHVTAVEGYKYEACLILVDTGAINGVASYANFCKAVGWELKYKDNFTSEEKSRMLEMAIERFVDFEEYSLGDLDVYEALDCFYQKWQVVYEKLGLFDYYQCPKLTIGGTVKDLFEAALAAKLGVAATDDNDKVTWKKELAEVIEQFIKPASASELRQFSTFTRALLSKVEGGRCRNNRPTDIFKTRKIKGKFDAFLICDIDISGCYGEGQRNQSYYLGNPEIFDYKACKNNDYISLREWLEGYEVNIEKLIKAVKEKNREEWVNPDNWGELVSGAWYARINTKQRLKYPQDYFASWFTETSDRTDLLAKAIRKMKCDTELVATDWVDFDEETGSLKIFNREILNAVLTHDGLQWILAICSPRQRNELLDNIQVLASAVYPRSQKLEVENPENGLAKLKEIYDNWEGKNTTKRVDVDGRKKIRMDFDECHTWFDINLGDLLINDLLIERKKAQKVYGKKSPLDVLFKLCVNTMYGDMVSKYFVTSNPVVGNNITGRARALAWYMEKGFHGWQSITDGCAFELNNVVFRKRDDITGDAVNLHRKESKLNRWKITRKPLGEVKEILGYWEDEKLHLVIDDEDKENPMEWIDNTAMTHLQEQFPIVDVLHSESTSIKIKDELSVEFKPRKGQFIFETKDVYNSGSFHGGANYLLANPNGKNIKARGFEVKRSHTPVEGEEIDESEEIHFKKSDRYGKDNSPAKDLLNQLLNNPEQVERQVPAIKSGILKISDYKNLSEKYDELGLEPGDSLQRSFLMQEFSLSQFTFQTYEQYMNWKKIIMHLKDTEKQSLEGYFLNNDGTLNFTKMCDWVDEKISEGVDKPFDLLCDKNRNHKRTEKRAKQAVKEGKYRGKKQKILAHSHPQLEVFKDLRERLNDKYIPEDWED